MPTPRIDRPWIKLAIHARDPKVLRVAELTGESPLLVVGRMVEWFRHLYEQRGGGPQRTTVLTIKLILGFPSSGTVGDTSDAYIRAMADPLVRWISLHKSGLTATPTASERYYPDTRAGWRNGGSDGCATVAQPREAIRRTVAPRGDKTRTNTRREEKSNSYSKRGEPGKHTSPLDHAPESAPADSSDSGSSGSSGSSDSAGARLVLPLAAGGERRITSRAVGRVAYQAAIVPLLGRDGHSRHPSGSPQMEADSTVTRKWWDELWPEDMDLETGSARLAGFMLLAADAARKNKPMAWLTSRLQAERLLLPTEAEPCRT